MNSKTPKIISGIVATISLTSLSFILLPRFWFWVSFEIIAALLVVIGCIGEWYLHHHPAGRKKREKDEHHKLESRFIFSIAVGVTMELFALGHSIQEGVKFESRVADANREAAIAEQDAAEANSRSKQLESDKLVLRKQVLELETRWMHRRITKEQHDKFIMALVNFPKGNVGVATLGNDNETANFARDIREMLNDGGFSNNSGIEVLSGLPISSRDTTEVQIFVFNKTNPPPFAPPLRAAFEVVGIPAVITFADSSWANPATQNVQSAIVFVLERH